MAIGKGVLALRRFLPRSLSAKKGVAQALPEQGISEERVFAPGADVILTIDQAVQFKVEQALIEIAEQEDAEFGSAHFLWIQKQGKYLLWQMFLCLTLTSKVKRRVIEITQCRRGLKWVLFLNL